MKWTKLPAQGDDMKERVLTFLDTAQTTKSRWFTVNGIAKEMHAANRDVKAALDAMSSEGWLHIRREPGREPVLLYRLRRDGDN